MAHGLVQPDCDSCPKKDNYSLSSKYEVTLKALQLLYKQIWVKYNRGTDKKKIVTD